MLRKILASFFLVVFFLIAAPLLLFGSIFFSYGGFDAIEKRVIPQSYELLLPKLLSVAGENLPETINERDFEAWFRRELSQETYIALLTKALRDIKNNTFYDETRIEIEIKESKNAFIAAVSEAFGRFPGISDVPESEKQVLILRLREELEIGIQPRFVFTRTSQNSFLFDAFSNIKLVARFWPFAIVLLLFPLVLMTLSLIPRAYRILRYNALAFLLVALESFALFWLFKQLPFIFRDLHDITPFSFLFVFPSRFLAAAAVIFAAVSLAAFLFSYRFAPPKTHQKEDEVHNKTVTIRHGKLIRGSKLASRKI